MFGWLKKIFKKSKKDKEKKKEVVLVFHRAVFADVQITIEGEITNMIISSIQEVDLAIRPLDRKGKPAQIDGIPVWSSGNPAFVALTPAPDGLTCVAKAMDIGSALITVTADADLGAGVRNISGTLQIDVVAAEAETIEIVAGEPREQP